MLNNHHHGTQSSNKPPFLKRADTSIPEAVVGESSVTAAKRPAAEPRLITPTLAQEFSILKIDLKMSGLNQSELVHSLEKNSIASLLDSQVAKSVRHLQSLRERIEDTASKVLVTGDLNAGKSTFCNALLRRKILPEDQQPCTSIFCEVLDVRENGGIEEVHAIPIGATYSRNDERTYEVYSLAELEKIVTDSERFSQCKIYIRDIRSVDESLLSNGVVDIALIDAPGLNADSVKTTALFARQEEIDVVVFVVSAANHFTLSARDFIFSAAREKAFIFMVVNGFDNIKDKNRCEEMILKQVSTLSPATYKESSELVHFVSSNAIPVAPAVNPEAATSSSSVSGGGSGGDDGPGNDPPDDDTDDDITAKHGEPGVPEGKNKGKEREKLRDFEELEASLRRFVLEKRARSKLAPAKTYLLNVLGDLHSLASINREVAQSEIDRVSKELQELEPVFQQSKKARQEAGGEAERIIDGTASDIYTRTRTLLNDTIAKVGESELGIEYAGILGAYQYAEEVKMAIIEDISSKVYQCEEHAREETSKGVNAIKGLGSLHLGEGYTDFTFRADKMFQRRKDALVRQVDVEVEAWDFFDVASVWERQEKVAGTGMAVTIVGVLGSRLIGGVGWVDGALGAARIVGSNNLRKLVIPGLVLGGMLSPFSSICLCRKTHANLDAVALGVSFALASIPHSLPRRLSSKISTQLAAMEYTHANALRISSEVRRALKYPADNLRIGLQRSVEKFESKRQETSKIRTESEVARKYFTNLVRESNDVRHSVERVDLEGPAPAALAH